MQIAGVGWIWQLAEISVTLFVFFVLRFWQAYGKDIVDPRSLLRNLIAGTSATNEQSKTGNGETQASEEGA